jgi:hypothetical protein
MSAPVDLPEPALPAGLDALDSPLEGRTRSKWVPGVSIVVALALIGGVLVATHALSSSARATPLERVIDAETAISHHSAFTFKLHGSELLTDGSSFQVVNNPVSISGSGALNKKSASAEMTFVVKVASLSVEIQEVLSAKTEYINFAALTPFLPSGKSWVEVPASALGSRSTLGDFSSSPELLKLLRDKEATVTATGPGRVDGTPVENYRINLDRAAAAALGGPVAESGTNAKAGSETVSIAIDPQNVIRQVNETIVQSKASSHVRIQLAFDFTRYGGPVTVTVPPAREVDSLTATQYEQLLVKAQAAPPSLV